LLQLAIGWHFLYEGWWKLTQKQHPWSSKEYIRHAQGPFALPIRWMAGDPDVKRDGSHFEVTNPTQDFLAQFAVTPFDPTEEPKNRKPHLHMPPVLAKQWDDYFKQFVEHHQLEREQRKLAEADFITSENETVEWLLSGSKKIKVTHGTGEFPESTPQRLQDYQKKLQEAQALEASELGMFGSSISAKVRKAQDEAKSLKQSLQEDLDDHTEAMKSKLRTLLTYEQKRMPPVPTAKAEAKPAAWDRIVWIDRVVKWGLFGVGAALLLGLFTRLACVAGSLFLIAFYLAMPPWPGLPEVAGKGHYFIINENIIETLALLTIAVSRPGSRYGLDAWIGLLLRPFRRRRPDWKETQPVTRPKAREALAR
jgi:uncharacterized membrane protein YphA (DoxX/SURF4 family)